MPIKRRRAKHRVTPEDEACLWYDVFSGGSFLLAGHDRELGVEFRGECYRNAQPTEEYLAWRERILIPAAREAWARLGRAVLDGEFGTCGRNDTGTRGAWALAEFGEPSHAD